VVAGVFFSRLYSFASYDDNAHLGIVLHHQRLAEPFVLHPSGIAFLAFGTLEAFVDSDLVLVSFYWLRLDATTVHGWQARIGCLVDIRMRAACSVVEKTTSLRGMSPRSRSSSKRHSAQLL
jgi:hypothetical protein